MPITGSSPTEEPKRLSDGFTRHHCTCRHGTVLGSHGYDAKGRYCYKIAWRDRVVVIYFGAFTVKCKDCSRWCRVRMLPKEQKVQINPMYTDPDQHDG